MTEGRGMVQEHEVEEAGNQIGKKGGGCSASVVCRVMAWGLGAAFRAGGCAMAACFGVCNVCMKVLGEFPVLCCLTQIQCLDNQYEDLKGMVRAFRVKSQGIWIASDTFSSRNVF